MPEEKKEEAAKKEETPKKEEATKQAGPATSSAPVTSAPAPVTLGAPASAQAGKDAASSTAAPTKDKGKEPEKGKDADKPKSTTFPGAGGAYQPPKPTYSPYNAPAGSSRTLVLAAFIMALVSLIFIFVVNKNVNSLFQSTRSDVDGLSTSINTQMRTALDSIDDLKFRANSLETSFAGLEDQVNKKAQVIELRKAIMILDLLSQQGEGKVKVESDRISSELENLVGELD